MTTKSIRISAPAARTSRHKAGEMTTMTALLTIRQLSDGEMESLSRVLAAEGIEDVRPTRILLSQDDALAFASGNARAIPASIEKDLTPAPAGGDKISLDDALTEARARGDAAKEELFDGPEMLSTAAIASLLGMSEEGIRLKRKRHEILGLESAKRGIRYPSWQVLDGRQVLPALPRLFDLLGDDPWRLFRFLKQRHNELGGDRALDALRNGKVARVLAAAENTAIGAFS